MNHVFATMDGKEFWVAESLEEAEALAAAADRPGLKFIQQADNHVLLVKTVSGPPTGQTCAMWAAERPKGPLFTVEQLFS